MMDQEFYMPNESLSSDRLHYTDCGLENIYLLNGFVTEYFDGEEYVSISDVDGLHRAIGLHIVLRRKAPSGKEIRFLREELDLSQAELGEILGVSDQSVARWEKGVCEAPGPAVLSLRFVYVVSLLPKEERHQIIDRLLEVTKKLAAADETTDVAQFEYTREHWSDVQPKAA